MDSKRRKTGDQDVSALRLASRQKYLAEREAQQLALLRRQVAEEAEEEKRLGNKLSERERAEFKKNRQTLELAEARNAIDDYRLQGGFHFQTDSDDPLLEGTASKNDVLYRRHNDAYDSRPQHVESNDYMSGPRIPQTTLKSQESQESQEDTYEFVFNEESRVDFKAMPQAAIDPEQQRLLAQLDEAETKARTIDEVRQSLPIFQYKDEFIAAVKAHQVLIVEASTGSGKSTQLTSYLADSGYGGNGKRIVCTQPRRVAAMSLAKRVAEENHSRLGKKVGFSVRFESQINEQETVIEYCTDGILMKALQSDPLLERYSVVILDEAHERSINTDLLITLTKDICQVRPEFRLIISSASMNVLRFSEYFNNAPLLSVPGRTYPVERFFATAPEANYLSAAITTVLQCHISLSGQAGEWQAGDILVFLTGQEEIEAAVQNLEDTMKKLGNKVSPLLVLPIYGQMPADQQAKIFERAAPGVRKVIVSSNIAETSLTVDGVTIVIDSGMEKQSNYDSRSGMSSLSVVPCSRASAEQRAGRAGRTGPGRCLHLYTRWSYLNELPEQHPPEIQRANFDATALLLKSLGVNDLLHFDFMDPPSVETLALSLSNLYAFAYLDSTGAITKLGRRASELPLEPQLAKTLLSAEQFSCVQEIVIICSMMQEASLWFSPKDKKVAAEHAKARFFLPSEGGDMMGLLRLYLEFEENEYSPLWARENFVQYRSISRVRDVVEQLLGLCDKVEIPRSSCGASDHVSIMKALTAGFFQNVARLQRDGQTYAILGKGGLSVRIHPSSCMSKTHEKWVIFHELISTSTEFIRSVAPIDPNWLTEVAPHVYKPSDLEKLGIDKKMPKAPSKMLQERSKTSAGHNMTMKTKMPKGATNVYGSAKPK